MGWELKGTPKTFRVTTRLATEFASMDAAHADRPLSERRLQVYRKVREQGGFRPVTWAKAWCEETGQYYRVNGKHTSTLFSDGQNPENLYVVVEEYNCKTLEDVARLYSTFDSQNQTRTTTDINRSFAAAIPELADMDTRLVNLLVGALAYQSNPSVKSGHDRGTPAERAELLFDHVEFCVWAAKVLGDRSKNQQLWRVPVVAAMFGCYSRAKLAATSFWLAVRDETGVSPELPDRKLARFLGQMRVSVGAHSNIPKRFRLTPREFYSKSVRAWNAWRKKETTDLKYFPDAKIPAFV
jgi:hypothetical protein